MALLTKKIETESDYLDLNTNYTEFNDSRRFEAMLTYRFNRGEKFKKVTNTKSNAEEYRRSR